MQEHTCVDVAIKSACYANNSIFPIKLKKEKKKKASIFRRSVVATKRMKMEMKKFACSANANSIRLILLSQLRAVWVSGS